MFKNNIVVLIASSLLSVQPAIAAVVTKASEAEVHVQICDTEAKIYDALNLNSGDAEPRRLWFFDNQDLSLYDEGIILRATQDGVEDHVKFDTKLRPVVIADLDDIWSVEEGFKCELDYYATRHIEGCRLRHKDTKSNLDLVISGSRQPQSLVTLLQQDFLDDGKSTSIQRVHLRVFGPAVILAWQLGTIAGLSGVELEIWQAGRGLVISELSLRVDRASADFASRQLRQHLVITGLNLCIDDEAKTRQVLESFR